MISTANITMQFGSKPLFENISVKFGNGNRYGLIGANGCGKSTFMKILDGSLAPSSGTVFITPHERVGKLNQDQFAFESFTVIDTVIMGHAALWAVKSERDRIYALPEMSEEDGMKVADLEVQFAEMDGYTAESRAGEFLLGAGIAQEFHYGPMSAVAPGWKLRVLLAQALFSDPDILLLDEPTNNLDINSIRWLEGVLNERKSTMIIISHDRHFLTNAFTHNADGSGVFESGQHPIVVGQKAYNTAYGTTFDTGSLGTSPNERLDGLVRMTDTTLDFQTLAKDPGARDGQVRLRSFPLQPKAMHDEMSASYDREYGRMSGNLGLEGPNKTAVGQQLMLYPYVNPPDYYGTPAIEAKYPFNGMTSLEPLATLDDGTQIWKITHNGVDTHPIHFHLFDIQLVNRVGWDNIIRKPEPSELGWKDTVRVSPLEDTIVALRPTPK